MRPWHGELLALAAGLALPLAFAPFGLFPLGLLAPAALLWLWQESTPHQALKRGFLFGLGQFGFGVHWVYVSIWVYGNSSLFTAILLTTLLAAYLALFPAAMGWLYTRVFPGQRSLPAIAAFPALWVLFEWLRGWLFTGFPWLWLGYSQIDTPLAWLAPVTGVLGVSWAAAMSAGLLVAAVRGPRFGHRVALAFAITTLWAVAALSGRVDWSEPAAEPMGVALIQGNVGQDIKWVPEELPNITKRYLELTREHWDQPLIIWPETALPAFLHETRELVDEIAKEARDHGDGLVFGVPVMESYERYYNSVMAIGEGIGLYHKRHLVPFGDYVPLADWLRGLIGFFDLPMSSFSAGPAEQLPLYAAGVFIAPSVCFEIAFPDEIRQWLPKSEVLVNVSNDAWFGTTIGPDQHFQIARMRALETGRWLLRATNTGITAIVDERGRIRRQAPQFQTGALTGEMTPRKGVTPFVAAGSLPILLLSLVLVAAGWLGLRWLDRPDRPRRAAPAPEPERTWDVPD